MKIVIIQSPFSGDTERNIAYARAAVRDLCYARRITDRIALTFYTRGDP